MSKDLYVMRKGSLFVSLILMFYFLPLHSTSATVWEYSISGQFDFFNTNDSSVTSKNLSGTAFIDDFKAPHYSLENLPFNCQPAPASNDCDVRFAFTHFDMDVGGEFTFTGSSGFIEYNTSDVFGELVGTGDWTTMQILEPPFGYSLGNYEGWLDFELPASIGWSMTSDGIVGKSPELVIAQMGTYGVSLERVGPVVPVPAAVWLFGSGLLGLIGVARRKVRA